MKADENEGGPQFVGANHVKCKRQGFRTSQEAAAVTPCHPARLRSASPSFVQVSALRAPTYPQRVF
jgi:hypothetical protein